MEPIPQDVVKQIEKDFPSSEWQARLEQVGMATESARVRRCVVWAARGHRWRFELLCRLAHGDIRDVIMDAEYDRFGDRFYNFSKPIGEAEIDPRGMNA